MIIRPQAGLNCPKRVKKNGEKSHLPSSSKRLTIKSFFGDKAKYVLGTIIANPAAKILEWIGCYLLFSNLVHHNGRSKDQTGLSDRSGLSGVVLSVGRFCNFLELFMP